MRLVIEKCLDRMKLIKFIRTRESQPLSKTIEIVENLPYMFEYVSKMEAESLQKIMEGFAICSIEREEWEDDGFPMQFNCNINPPQEYIDASAWYETLTDQHKQFVDEIVKWRSRPAVC